MRLEFEIKKFDYRIWVIWLGKPFGTATSQSRADQRVIREFHRLNPGITNYKIIFEVESDIKLEVEDGL